MCTNRVKTRIHCVPKATSFPRIGVTWSPSKYCFWGSYCPAPAVTSQSLPGSCCGAGPPTLRAADVGIRGPRSPVLYGDAPAGVMCPAAPRLARPTAPHTPEAPRPTSRVGRLPSSRMSPSPRLLFLLQWVPRGPALLGSHAPDQSHETQKQRPPSSSGLSILRVGCSACLNKRALLGSSVRAEPPWSRPSPQGPQRSLGCSEVPLLAQMNK